jgi:hypothetical protein
LKANATDSGADVIHIADAGILQLNRSFCVNHPEQFNISQLEMGQDAKLSGYLSLIVYVI